MYAKIVMFVVFCVLFQSCNTKSSEPKENSFVQEYYEEYYSNPESQNNNSNIDTQYEDNNISTQYEDTYNNRVPSYNGESVKGRDHYVGRDGRVYENKSCGFCGGSGYIQSYDMVSGQQVMNVCNACDGVGQLSY